MILAAGAGTRFQDPGHRPKLLASVAGRPLLQHALDALCAAGGLSRVVLVLGARADEVAAGVTLDRAEIVFCERWSEGQSASLRSGLEALIGPTPALAPAQVLITLGDQPVSRALVERILHRPAPARAVFGGRPGHPVLLGPREIAACRQLSGDQGARRLLADAHLIECSDLASGRDVDTVEDLRPAHEPAP